MTRIITKAFAKINLNLRILGRRADGFHDIDTVVQSVSLADTLTLEDRPEGVTLEVDDPAAPANPTNLVWRAAAALPVRGVRGVHIRLRKGVPAGAGLGGGSSDAAATLIALNRLWSLGLATGDLVPIAARLGSDVPYFLEGGTAHLGGRGTEVSALPDLLGYRLLIVFPGTMLSTKQVYAEVRAPLTPPAKTDRITRFRSIAGQDVEAWIGLGNDLAVHAQRLCSVIGEIESRLLDLGATAAAMTGSGSAVYGVFRDVDALREASRSVARPGWRIMTCEPVGRREFRRSFRLAGSGNAPPSRDVGHGNH